VKRLFLVFAVVVAATAVGGAATAARPDALGPPCTNFVFGDAGYNSAAGFGTVDMRVAAASTCADATYLLDVYDASGETPLLNDVQPTATSGSLISFEFSLSPSAHSNVCVVVESYFHGRLIDRAPNTGCQLADPTSSGGQAGFN
jgi:hypothetical protein